MESGQKTPLSWDSSYHGLVSLPEPFLCKSPVVSSLTFFYFKGFNLEVVSLFPWFLHHFLTCECIYCSIIPYSRHALIKSARLNCKLLCSGNLCYISHFTKENNINHILTHSQSHSFLGPIMVRLQ